MRGFTTSTKSEPEKEKKLTENGANLDENAIVDSVLVE